MNMEKKLLFMTVLILFFTTPLTSNAGVWKSEEQNRWWYDNEDGTYANGGWYWIDGNNDKIEECYYFDENGWLLADTVTPDGYQVNNIGQWIVNEEVKSRVNENSKFVNNSRKENVKIKSIGVQEVGRPTWVGIPKAYTRNGKLKTVIKLDKKTTLIPTFIYNEKGYLIDMYDYSSSEAYDISSRKAITVERKYNREMYSYDDNGRIVRRWLLTPDFEGMPTDNDGYWSYEYDSRGKLVKEIQHAYEGRTSYIHRQTSYYYDNYGRIIKQVIKNTRSAPVTGITFLYATHGEIEVVDYVYDDSNRTIKMYVTYDGKGSSPAGTVAGPIFKANENGDIIEIQSETEPSFLEYDTNNRVIRLYYQNSRGEIFNDSQYIYE